MALDGPGFFTIEVGDGVAPGDMVVLNTNVEGLAEGARVRVTRANAVLNGVKPLIGSFVAAGLNHPRIAGNGPYDLIFANILAKPLRLLATAPYLSMLDAPQREAAALMALKVHGDGYDVSLVFFGIYCAMLGWLSWRSAFHAVAHSCTDSAMPRAMASMSRPAMPP